MYEDIRKPKMLRDVPLSFIRPLPCLYYFSQYANGHVPDFISELVSANIRYMESAQKILGTTIGVHDFEDIGTGFHELCSTPAKKMKVQIEQLTRQLSESCTEHKSLIRPAMRELKTDLNKSYQNTVPALSVLFIRYDGQSEDSGKIIQLLEKFCHYKTQSINRADRSYSEQIIHTDFVVFNSTQPALIHNDVLSLSNFAKPGLAVMELSKGENLDAQSVRHAMQLIRSGFQVLFKVFTPIRLFTSIDREYIRFHMHQ